MGEIGIKLKDIKEIKEMLETAINDSAKVFIVSHDVPDYDAIGSALGISTLCKFLEKESYIIVNDADIELEPGVKKIIDDNKEVHNIINLEEFKKLKDKNSILITTDVNKVNRISVKDYLDSFKDIIIIDHHNEDDNTIQTEKKYINTKVSSASEMIALVLNAAKTKYNKEIANYLLAGIILDSGRYVRNATDTTHDISKKLIRMGADTKYVNDLFLRKFDDEGRISLLIYPEGNTIFKTIAYSLLNEYNVTFTLNRKSPDTIYKKVDIAKASDKMLKFEIDAAFVVGYVNENVVSISARSRSDIDVGKIMSNMNGGGSPESAATRIEGVNDILEIEEILMQKVEEYINNIEDQEKPKKLIKTTRKV